jgi:Ni,Fe-hydrogenase maturation factor
LLSGNIPYINSEIGANGNDLILLIECVDFEDLSGALRILDRNDFIANKVEKGDLSFEAPFEYFVICLPKTSFLWSYE